MFDSHKPIELQNANTDRYILPAHFHIFLMFPSYRNKAEPPLFETTRSFKFFPRLISSHPGIYFIKVLCLPPPYAGYCSFTPSHHMACTLLTGFTVFTEPPPPHFLTVPYVHLSQWTAGSERRQSAAEATPALLSLWSITSLLSAWHSPAHSLVDLVPSGVYSTQLFWNTFSSPYPRPQLFSFPGELVFL